MKVEKSRIFGIVVNIVEIAILIWFAFFNGSANWFNVVLVWNWISTIGYITVMGIASLLMLITKLGIQSLGDVTQTDKVTESFKAMRKALKSNVLTTITNILHCGVLGLIAYSGHVGTAIILGVLFIAGYVLKLMTLGIIGDNE